MFDWINGCSQSKHFALSHQFIIDIVTQLMIITYQKTNCFVGACGMSFRGAYDRKSRIFIFAVFLNFIFFCLSYKLDNDRAFFFDAELELRPLEAVRSSEEQSLYVRPTSESVCIRTNYGEELYRLRIQCCNVTSSFGLRVLFPWESSVEHNRRTCRHAVKVVLRRQLELVGVHDLGVLFAAVVSKKERCFIRVPASAHRSSSSVQGRVLFAFIEIARRNNFLIFLTGDRTVVPS